MKTVSDIKVKNFTHSSYAVFENGNFISTGNWENMIKQATEIANEGSKCTIATLRFGGDEESTVGEGTVIMMFTKINDTVYITNQID